MWNGALVAAICSAGLLVLSSGIASGQNYPTHPIRIVTAPAGGGTGGGDFVTRWIAQGISGPLGQTVIVDNRATTTIGAIVSKAPADGYTLALLGNSFWITPLLQKVAYDPIADFTPITLANRSPNILVVNPSLPVKTVKELIALAKAQPGKLNYAGGSQGSSSAIAAELFKAMAGVNILGVNYSGGEQAITALIGGEVQLRFSAEAGPFIKDGKLRAVAVTSPEPSALGPGLPTVAEVLPGYKSEVIQAVFAPVNTPEAVIRRLNQEIVRVLSRPDTRERLMGGGSEPAPTTPQEAAATIKDDMTTVANLFKGMGVTPKP
jgi:tripartite-type tricarboxylate transporter receptor subunit TctC